MKHKTAIVQDSKNPILFALIKKLGVKSLSKSTKKTDHKGYITSFTNTLLYSV